MRASAAEERRWATEAEEKDGDQEEGVIFSEVYGDDRRDSRRGTW